MNMVKSMQSYNIVILFLWRHTLKSGVYLLNRNPSKVVFKKFYELWIGRKPSLKHHYVWGCTIEVRVYNPHEKKLDARTISGFFIGYPEKSKGYIFYCPNHTRIFEFRNVQFVEIGHSSMSDKSQKVNIVENYDESPSPNASCKDVVPSVVLRSNNNKRKHNYIQNPQDEHMVDEPTNNVQVTN